MPKSSKSKSQKRWEMRLAGLAMDPASNVPVVVLRDLDDLHQLPIWIGQVEAMAIATELEGVKHSRPMTHDLLKNALERVGWRVARIEICDLRENTFYARIVVEHDGEELDIDSRPSDALALAIRTGAKVFVADHVVQQARMDVPDDEAEEEAQGGEVRALSEKPKEPVGPKPLVGPMPSSDQEWEELLEGLDPAAFGKYKQ
jgi:uncharacterized protein